jgi:N-acetylmuramoyl-L-alanine amidase
MKTQSTRVVSDSSEQSNRKPAGASACGSKWARKASLFALIAVLAIPTFGATVQQKKQIARGQFEKAEELREELNGTPIRERKQRDYQKVMDAYRRVYYLAPTSNRADAAVVAVAELLAEQGRNFKDEKSLHDAIGQYEFVRREYPGSKYRVEALFTIGQIYREDLNDDGKAKETFEDFLKHYPNSENAEGARQALKEMDEAANPKAPPTKKQAAALAKNTKPERKTEAATVQTKAPAATPLSSLALTAEQKLTVVAGEEQDTPDTTEHRAGHHVLVTGIRHWSTPDYTRIAVDLEDSVEYSSERIDHPDRIYFDLKDSRLASVLLGKSFEVGDGFLRKIRVAQYRPGEARIVLEVEDSYDYSAFLLPNPYRLIIDIHGRKPAQLQAKSQPKTASVATAAQDPSKQELAASTKAPGIPVASMAKAEAPAKGAPGTPVNTTTAAKQGQTPANSAAKTVTSETIGSKPTVANTAKVMADTPASQAQVKRVDAQPSERDRQILEKEIARKVTALAGDKSSSKGNAAELPARIVVDDNDAQAPVKSSTPITTQKRNVEVAGVTTSALSDALAADSSGTGSSRAHVKRQAADKLAIREAKPTMDGDRSLIRALGLKIGRIVVDAGHGGHDTGTIGPNGLREKDLVLDVALRLGKLLDSRMGAEVVYTRDDDTFVPLETRTAIANQQQADLFISIHANSSPDPSARGVETYYLNFTSSRDALDVAARENAVSEKSIHELQDLVKKIALKEKIEESREFAADVQRSLYAGLAPTRSSSLRDRGVKKAPFIVLIGANMPSILAEISFISNPGDEHKLETPEYRQKIAESLYRGVAKYVGGLSGVKVASKIPDKAGQ